MTAPLAARIARAREDLAREAPDPDPLLPALLDVAEAGASLDFDGGLCGMDEPEYHYEFTKAEVNRLREALARLSEVLP